MNVAEKKPLNREKDQQTSTGLVAVSSAGTNKSSVERNMIGLSPEEYIPQVLSYIPNDFNGNLLEFPAGNHAFTAEKFKNLSGAAITVVDQNDKILLETQKSYERAGIRYAAFYACDPARLKNAPETFDYILCINGFHSFSDNVSTFREAARVLKKGGHLCGCCYIRKQSHWADLMVNLFQVKKGNFVPPFHTYQEMKKNLCSNYSQVELKVVKSLLIFHCIK